ncbi:hypothetical protein AX774_g6811 [Zancudomyces culisetae]|uniref:Uncharacterized protein n=1 Tax=Zancudomyces culisetae TaxID=1213189 RepID=A0A1R1PFS7_ZANCU|nr:hypothetical protein AX774_g6811 [Zancudomyces culisetae]|eukprot:OMH79768.1 hypothetical protein AX774_g6811 [Zancudomyces culisetae]
MVLNVSEYHEREQNDATVGTHTQPNSQSDASSNVGDKMSDFDPTQCVMFFDIDNCLYHRNSGIEQFMKDR